MAPKKSPLTCLKLIETVSMRLMSGFPVLFVCAVIGWSYYVYVVLVCAKYVESIPEKVLFLIVYHVLMVLHVTSYFRAINTSAGTPPAQFSLTDAEIEALEEDTDARDRVLAEKMKELPVKTRMPNGNARYCERCKLIKPDRCHHCSLCGKCVLKMDHHCPWVNNCVGYGNYKFFILFLFYTILYTVYVAASSCPYFIAAWHHSRSHDDSSNSTATSLDFPSSDRINIIFVFFLAVLFCFSVLTLFCFHIYLLLSNQTTLESGRQNHFEYGPDKSGFDLGRWRNIEQVMGVVPIFWLFPIGGGLGNGFEFPLRMSDGERERLLAAEEGRAGYSGLSSEEDHV